MKHFQVLNPDSDGPILVSCEHASKIIPEEYSNFGVKNPSQLPDWHDVGAGELALLIVKQLKARGIMPLFSRMVINVNKPIGDPKLINDSCFGVRIPGNENLSLKEKKERIFKYYLPYHRQLKRELLNLKKQHQKIFFVSVHSFFHKINREERKIDIGILYKYKKDFAFCNKIKKLLEKKTNFDIRFNKPYSAHETAGYTINKYGNDKNINCIEFEINDRHLKTKENIQKIGEFLSEALEEAIKSDRV